MDLNKITLTEIIQDNCNFCDYSVVPNDRQPCCDCKCNPDSEIVRTPTKTSYWKDGTKIIFGKETNT